MVATRCSGALQRRDLCITACIAVLLSSWFVQDSIADAAPLTIANQMSVEGAYASSGTVGDSIKIEFRLINDSASSIVLLGATSPVARQSQLIGRIGNSETAQFDSISVPKQEVLDLTTSHMWLELKPLRQPLLPGDVIRLTLIFTHGELSVDVHVH